MKKVMVLVFLLFFTIPAVAHFDEAQVQEVQLQFVQSKFKMTLADLRNKQLISEESVDFLLTEGGIQQETVVEVKAFQNINMFISQGVKKGELASELLSVFANPGDEREYRWQEASNGSIYAYVYIERFTEDFRWIQVFYSRTYIGPEQPEEPPEKQER